MDPPHSARTGSSATGPANFNCDFRLIAPFYSEVRKPLCISAHKNLYDQPGLRRRSYPGNPVIVGCIYLAGFKEPQRPFYVTGDTDDEDNVTLTIQDKDQLGFAISDNEEIVQEAMKKAREFTQTDTTNILEIHPTMWMLAMKTHTDIEWLEIFDERFGNDPSWVRDSWPSLFMSTITNYVVQTIKQARKEERRYFLAEMPNLYEIYKRCGWMDLAKMDPEEWSQQFGKCVHHDLGVELPGMPL